MNPDFWQNKKVFLTGHTGFKGSWLSLWLQTLGAQVTGYALAPPTNPSLFEQANIALGMQSIIADIRDLNTLQVAMQMAKPDIVIHMAAQPLVRYSYIYPVETYAVNVMGTVNLLEAVRSTPSVKAVVNVTTDKCYENKEWFWGYRETEAMGGHDPYSSSKGCSELVTAAYRASFFNAQTHVALASARAGNVIGGGDWAQDRLVPDMINAFTANNPVVIRNPYATRPWQHVLEPLRGYLTLAEHLYTQGQAFASGWNFGPRDQDAKPVEWIVKKLISYWGENASWQLDKSDFHPHEANWLKLDISKSFHQLNWQPILTLDEALKMIVSWNKDTQAGLSPKEVTLAQIQMYQTLTSQPQ